MIRVEKEAQRTDAYQKNDNLMLSATARADSIPGLEIEANDVRCTHGATAGRVDEEMIFAAQARGIPRKIAIRLIVEGFFANVYDRITLEPVQETLRHAVAAKLEKLEKSRMRNSECGMNTQRDHGHRKSSIRSQRSYESIRPASDPASGKVTENVDGKCHWSSALEVWHLRGSQLPRRLPCSFICRVLLQNGNR